MELLLACATQASDKARPALLEAIAGLVPSCALSGPPWALGDTSFSLANSHMEDVEKTGHARTPWPAWLFPLTTRGYPGLRPPGLAVRGGAIRCKTTSLQAHELGQACGRQAWAARAVRAARAGGAEEKKLGALPSREQQPPRALGIRWASGSRQAGRLQSTSGHGVINSAAPNHRVATPIMTPSRITPDFTAWYHRGLERLRTAGTARLGHRLLPSATGSVSIRERGDERGSRVSGLRTEGQRLALLTCPNLPDVCPASSIPGRHLQRCPPPSEICPSWNARSAPASNQAALDYRGRPKVRYAVSLEGGLKVLTLISSFCAGSFTFHERYGFPRT